MRITISAVACVLTTTALISLSHRAAAFDPNAGADDTYVAPGHQAQPAYVTPRRYARSADIAYVPAAYAPVTPAPAPVIAPRQDIYETPPSAPAIAAVPPAQRMVPVEQPAVARQDIYEAPPVAPAPVYPAAPPPAAVPYQPAYTSFAAAPQPTHKVNQYSLGVDGFWDRYREPIADLETNSAFGGLTGSWTHYYDPLWFSKVELRGDYGREDYKSISGSEDGITAWEYDARMLAGYDKDTGGGGHIKPYLGLDMRYYREDGKGGVTSLDKEGYDRRILQFFLPVGVTYDMPTSSGYHLVPTLEGGPLLYGNVSSRLGNIPGNTNEVNHQHSGYEVRGDFMVDKLNAQGQGLEFGPFIRYYHVDDSDITGTGIDRGGEPNNSRLQVGGKASVLF